MDSMERVDLFIVKFRVGANGTLWGQIIQTHLSYSMCKINGSEYIWPTWVVECLYILQSNAEFLEYDFERPHHVFTRRTWLHGDMELGEWRVTCTILQHTATVVEHIDLWIVCEYQLAWS